MFCNYKPFYLSKPTVQWVYLFFKKEKETCQCTDCLNPHLVLKSINKFRKSVDVHASQSSTTFLDEFSNIDRDDDSLFPERENDKEAHHYVYEWKPECYK